MQSSLRYLYNKAIYTVLITSILALQAPGALAQVKPAAGADYPNRSVKFIIAQAPGGNADFIARLVAAKLGEAMGQSFVTDNRPGAGGIPATDATAKASPDGYTMLLTGSSFGLNPGLYPSLPYDPLKDLAPITMPSNAPNMVVVTPSLPVRNIKELVDLARVRPGELNFGSSANGGSTHLAGELLKVMAGISMTHVPYKGAAPALIDLIAGRIQLSFATIPSVMGHVRSGKLRAIAVTSARRSSVAPELPTIIEAGYPGFEIGAWQGIFTTAGTPKPVIDRLNREIIRAMRSPDVLKRLADEGAEPVGNSPEEFAQWLRVEIPKWTQFIKTVGIKVD